ncbi:hypothetical protein HK098_006130 [Nowakowskiella sp. JEL0407]|nr:hypothetical protein HK098_006130 [Nowakowskiella sp. JEL0407]
MSESKLQQKFNHWTLLKSQKNISFNDQFLKPAFRNPALLEKLRDFLDLDEYGSNYERNVWDPDGFLPEMFFDELVKAQQAALNTVPSTNFTAQNAYNGSGSSSSLQSSSSVTSSSTSGIGAGAAAAAAALQVAQKRSIQFTSAKSSKKSKWDQ